MDRYSLEADRHFNNNNTDEPEPTELERLALVLGRAVVDELETGHDEDLAWLLVVWPAGTDPASGAVAMPNPDEPGELLSSRVAAITIGTVAAELRGGLVDEPRLELVDEQLGQPVDERTVDEAVAVIDRVILELRDTHKLWWQSGREVDANLELARLRGAEQLAAELLAMWGRS